MHMTETLHLISALDKILPINLTKCLPFENQCLKNYNRVISLGYALYFRITVSIMASLGRAVTTLGVRSSISNSLRTSLAYCTKSFADPKTCDANAVNLVTHTGQVNIYSIKSVIN